MYCIVILFISFGVYVCLIGDCNFICVVYFISVHVQCLVLTLKRRNIISRHSLARHSTVYTQGQRRNVAVLI